MLDIVKEKCGRRILGMEMDIVVAIPAAITCNTTGVSI
jgi:hypothetical protein